MSKISIVTICKNDPLALERTLKSVKEQSYSEFEYLLIDGGDCDRTRALAFEYKDIINHYINESDVGIYHAMNKGVFVASGEWILFMNSGDVFASKDALLRAIDIANNDVDVIYSDWIYRHSRRLVRANISKLNVRHQSLIYRKSLHNIYGYYVVGKRVSISDYIYFLSISHVRWRYCSSVISICDEAGVSSAPMHFYQRIASEIIFGRRSRINGGFILLAYPLYRFLKRIWLAVLK